MFYPLAMRQVTVQLLQQDLPVAALALAEIGVFHPDPDSATDHGLERVPGEVYRQLHHQASARLEKILEHLPALNFVADPATDVIAEAPLAELNDRLGELWQDCSARQEALRVIDDEQRQIGQLQDTLALLANIGVDLRALDRQRLFLDLRVGAVSRFNLERIRDALGLAGFVVYPFMEHEDSTHVVIAGPRGDVAGRVDAVLESAAFRDLPVPAELRDDPDRVRRHLHARRQQTELERDTLVGDIQRCASDNGGFLFAAQGLLDAAAPFVEIDGAARVSRQLVVLCGWVPARRVDRVEQTLRRVLPNPFAVHQRPPRVAELARVPTLLRERRWLAPFTGLVKQYGIPGYREIDPSVVFAATFVLMFGMMFGDVGHGAVIALLALLARRRLGRFCSFGVAAGLSSAAFGWVYGSVFGFEHWLHPLWISPMSDPVLLLKVALGWGIGFLVLMTLLFVHNRMRAGDFAAAFMDTHGAVNLLLYGSLLWIAWAFAVAEPQPLAATIGLLAALAILVAYKWRHSEVAPGERVMVVAVECFEAIMGNISGTLSFLRVAAFSINHVALALAVFTLADLMQPLGQGLMIVGGNLFILVLEGAIVAIQALRLEYYEGFSRFFTGDGHAFRPLLPVTRTVVAAPAGPAAGGPDAADQSLNESRSTP